MGDSHQYATLQRPRPRATHKSWGGIVSISIVSINLVNISIASIIILSLLHYYTYRTIEVITLLHLLHYYIA